MLPPGHFAAGYIAASALIKITHPAITSSQSHKLLLWGAIIGILPDLDLIITFIKSKSLKLHTDLTHRKFISHAPILWLIAGLAVYFFASSVFFKEIGLLIWVCSWSHFVLDSIEYGIMWLWPFNSKRFALHYVEEKDKFLGESTFGFYWKLFTQDYTKTITFWVEGVIIITALVLFFR